MTYSNMTNGSSLDASLEGLQALLSQVETDLYHSEVYHQVLTRLQIKLGGATGSVQPLIQALGRESIRLTLEQFVRNAQTSNSAHATAQPVVAAPQPPAAPPMLGKPIPPTLPSPPVLAPDDPIDLETPLVKIQPKKKLSRAELVAQKAEEERNQQLCQIGQQLRQARLERGLSLEQVHSLTLVPTHQLIALESGHVERLPEDVYVRGFIRRIGNTLGLNGAQLAASLPGIDPNKAIIPSWYQKSVPNESKFELQSIHLYLGYAALVTGAIGGVNLLSQHQASQLVPAESTQPTQPALSSTKVAGSTCKATEKHNPAHTGQQTNWNRSNVSAPELMGC